MARGYLGKISAIVAVNTDDARSRLSASAKDFQRYARSVQSTIGGATTSAGRSFDAIFTPLQKLQRALAATQNGNLGRTLGLGIDQAEVTRVQQLVSAAEQLAKPLGNSAKQFAALSAEIAGEFQPALVRAQSQVELARVAINQFGSIGEKAFAGVEARVQSTTQAIARLVEVQNLVDGGRTGQELAFRAPRVQDELSRSAQLSQQAANLPVALREDPSVRARIEELARLRQEIARYQASVERRQVLGLDTREAQAQLDGVIRRSADARAALERVTGADAAPIIARARAEREFYEESQRLRQQALADQRAEAEAAVAPIVARARAEREFYEESQRLRQQAEDDNRAAAQRASELLTVDQLASNEGLRSQRATVLPPDYFQRGFESQIRGELGPAITDQQRQFDVLRGSIVSVKGQLDTLPVAVRSQFIPAIQQAEAEFQRLRAIGPDATAEAIENAANEVDRLNQQLRRASQVQALPNFAQALDDSSLRGAIGSLNALQQVLTRVGAQAGSDAAAQFDRMRAAIQRATRDGTIGTEAFQNELRQLSREAANAAAATGRISANAAFRQIQRGGDIARGGFDNLSLAVQQAAFAIDDFFSSTGDFTQRIRAVQNNVTQLAFILGGTTGLFIGLGVAIAAQASVLLYNWVNGGRTAEDQTKALNDALARQKSLVEQLAQAFESLGDAIVDRAFSQSEREARRLFQQLDEIATKQRELREARIVDANPQVQRERSDQTRIQRELDRETDGARRIILQRELEQSRQTESRLAARSISAQAPSGAEIRQLLQDTAASFEEAAQNRIQAGRFFSFFGANALNDEGAPTAALPANIRAQLAATNFGGTTQAIESQIQAIESAIGFLSPIADSQFLGARSTNSQQAADAIQAFDEIAKRLRSTRLEKELDDLAGKIFVAGSRVSSQLELAQDEVSNAIRAGAPGAAALEQRINALADQLRLAFADLEKSRSAGTPDDQRSQLRASAEGRIADVSRRQQGAFQSLDAARRDITLNPERQIDQVISRIEAAISSIGDPASGLEATLRSLLFDRETVRQQRQLLPADPLLIQSEQNLADALRGLEVQVGVLADRFGEFGREVQSRANPRGDAIRGLDFLETPGQRAARDVRQRLADIDAAASGLEDRVVDAIAPGGIPQRAALDAERAQLQAIERDRQDARRRAIEDNARAIAPAVFSLADSVQNAILQGPSRAALGVADIATQDGGRELTRLLRGDDSARDNPNLIELQRQSQLLEDNNRILRENLEAA